MNKNRISKSQEVFHWGGDLYPIKSINKIIDLKKRIKILELCIDILNKIRAENPHFINIQDEKINIYADDRTLSFAGFICQIIEHINICTKDNDLSTDFIEDMFSCKKR